jgi:hypothetical protein
MYKYVKVEDVVCCSAVNSVVDFSTCCWQVATAVTGSGITASMWMIFPTPTYPGEFAHILLKMTTTNIFFFANFFRVCQIFCEFCQSFVNFVNIL